MCRSCSWPLRHWRPFAEMAIRNMRFLKAVASTSRCGLSSLHVRSEQTLVYLLIKQA